MEMNTSTKRGQRLSRESQPVVLERNSKLSLLPIPMFVLCMYFIYVCQMYVFSFNDY